MFRRQFFQGFGLYPLNQLPFSPLFPPIFRNQEEDDLQDDLQEALERSLQESKKQPHDQKIDRGTEHYETYRNLNGLATTGDDDDELKTILQISKMENQQQEFHTPPEKRQPLEKDMNDVDDEEDQLKMALSQSMAEEKLRREEAARAEEEARAKEAALMEKQQEEEMELERALLLSKEQEEREARQRLLEEQDQAYQESLARDKAKEEQQRQEEDRLRWEQLMKEREEEEQELADAIHLSESLTHMSQKERDIRRRLAELPPEPSESDPSAVHLVIQLPSGRIERFFRLNSTFYEVKIFVASRTLEEFGGLKLPENYNLVTDFPRRVWDNLGLKLYDAGFQKRQLLRVEVA